MGGASDIPKLTKKGEGQAKDLGKALLAWKVDKIYSSPLKRTTKTAQIINQFLKKEVVFVDDLQERNWGELEGGNRDEIIQKLDKLDEKSRLKFKPLGGESLEKFEKRIIKCVETIIEANPDKTVLLVTHAGVVKVLVPVIKKVPREELFDLKIKNTSLTIFKMDEDKVLEELINDVSHLEKITT